jgi:two-component system aerobic respiration control sensor histidine kinase ArcB
LEKTGENAMQNLSSAHLKSILLVDYDDASRITTKWYLAYFNFEVHSARSGEEALALFDRNIHDLIITDNRLPGLNGQELAQVIKMRAPATPVIMYTSDPPKCSDGLKRVIRKPTQFLTLQEAAHELIASKPRITIESTSFFQVSYEVVK